MLLSLLIHVDVLKDLICQDKHKKIKLKHNHTRYADIAKIATCVTTEKLDCEAQRKISSQICN